MKIGLALAGGGARGLSHIGVLKVFEERGLVPDVICGTSIGAIVGGKYALVPSWKVVWEDFKRSFEGEAFEKAGMELLQEGDSRNPFQEFLKIISKGIVYSKALTSLSLVSLKSYLEAIKDYFLYDILIEETRIPFGAVALDMKSGKEVLITRGSLIKAVAASSALPGIFPPVPWGDYLLVDGGWIDVMPSSCAFFMGADIVIGVWIGKDIAKFQEPRNSFDVVARADEIVRHYLGIMRKNEACFVIEPEVSEYMWNEFDKADEIFEKGIEAAEKVWDDLKHFLKREKVKHFLIGHFKKTRHEKVKIDVI